MSPGPPAGEAPAGSGADDIGSAARGRELALRLAAVEERVQNACAAAGRARSELTLVVVTKTHPADDVRRLVDLGVRDVAESRDQEAAPKVAEVTGAPGSPGVALDLRWHFVGQLQRNKAGSVATYADVVHSVDRLRLVGALDRGAEAAGRRLGALVQVDLGGSGADPQAPRGGVAPDHVTEVAAALADADHLTLRGVMAVAPRGADPAVAFALLQEVAARLRAEHPQALWVSAGMSGDLEQAVAHGATHLRVGTAVLGSRPSLG